MSGTTGTIRIPLQQYAYLEVVAETPEGAIEWAEDALKQGIVDVVQRLSAAANAAAGLGATVVAHVDSSTPEAVAAHVDSVKAATAVVESGPVQASPSAEQCQHGAKIFKSGVSAAGKPWQAWMCPAPKGTPDQCKPEWIR